MARNRNKMSLYEVIGQSRSKSGYGKTLKKLRQEKTTRDEPVTAKTAIPSSGRAVHWPRKPKILQFNAGRIEISLPYPLAIAVLLGIVLLFLLVFRIGEVGGLSKKGISGSTEGILNGLRKRITGNVAGTEERTGDDEIIPPDTGKTGTEVSTGNNRIVIQTFNKRVDLELVQYYFAEGGIETEIRKIGDTFYLVTVNKYEKDPKIAGTDGYADLQKIIRWGARYKAPQGYESFAPNLFSDAYGKKFDD